MVYTTDMRLFLLFALVAIILAIVALAIPASILFSGVLASGLGWVAVALGFIIVDLHTGYAVPVASRRV